MRCNQFSWQQNVAQAWVVLFRNSSLCYATLLELEYRVRIFQTAENKKGFVYVRLLCTRTYGEQLVRRDESRSVIHDHVRVMQYRKKCVTILMILLYCISVKRSYAALFRRLPARLLISCRRYIAQFVEFQSSPKPLSFRKLFSESIGCWLSARPQL